VRGSSEGDLSVRDRLDGYPVSAREQRGEREGRLTGADTSEMFDLFWGGTQK
jgi:hypothetical protein